MRNKITFVSIIALIALFFLCQPSFSQLIELDQEQSISIPNSGFFPFSSEANSEFKSLVKQNPNVGIIIKNINSKKIKIAPAGDGREIGKKIHVRTDGAYVIKFGKTNANTFGLSFVPKSKPTTISLQVQPFAKGSCPNPIANCAGSDGTSCGENLGKCCEADANGNQKKICGRVGASKCDCVVMSR